MAAIGKIREKSGLLLVIIGVALAAFVLGDLFQNLGKGSNFDQSRVALINDEKVGSQDFSYRVSEQAELIQQNQQKSSLSPEESYKNVIDVWNLTKKETILRQEMVELGLIQTQGNSTVPAITMEEYMENINGKNQHPGIRSFFGEQYSEDIVKNFLAYIERSGNSENQEERQQAVQAKKQWELLKKYIKTDVINTKYNNLISKAYYMPKALAEVDFEENGRENKIAFFSVRYSTINDDEVELTDADYQAYYDEHKHEFESKEENRKIEYITWSVTPSEEDIKDLQQQISDYANELNNAPVANIPYVVNRIGDNKYDSTWVKKGSLSPYIDSAAFEAEPGTILGPWTENSAYHVARVVGKEMRPDSMKASHILISFKGAYGATDSITRNKENARQMADSIKNLIKSNPSDLAKLSILSDDPSAVTNKGEMDWFADGTMVPQFNQACIEGKKGDIVVVETVFGFHVIRIDDKQENTPKIRIAQIDLPITFSQETFEKVYGEASKFAAINQNYESFEAASADQGLNVVKGEFVNNMAAGISGLKNSRNVVKWMFNEQTEAGTVSQVFDFENKVAVAVLTEIKPEGMLPIEFVKENIKPLVIRDVKAKMITEKLSNITSISQASEFNTKADTISISFSNYSLPGHGPEMTVQGKMFAGEVGSISAPIKGEQGVYIFSVLEEGAKLPNPSYKDIQNRESNYFGQRVYSASYDALEENAEIEEFLYFFY